MRSSLWAAVVCVLLAVGVPAPAAASECTACQYRARNCSAASSGSGSAVDDTSIDVCDAAGTIQVDDVFCDEDSCNCAADRQCVNLVVGCANLFQARSRRRCLGNDTIQAKFQRCAIDQGLTTLSETNLASDWVFFKQSAQCTSQDCVAVRQFHASGAVQCGHLLVAWKDEGADAGSNATYHFVVDGSRGSDLKPGTFHYSVPWLASTATLQSSAVNSSSVDRCYSLQTRNERNGSTCDGVYLEFDTSVQLSNSDNYVLSKLSWPVWLAVVGSVAVAAIAVGVVATVFYRLKRAERELDDNSGDGLLGELDDLRDRASVAKTQRASTLSTTDAGSDADSGIRQRAKEADEQEDKVAAVL